MGLDQYLSVRKYISRIEWKPNYEREENQQFRYVAIASGLAQFLEDDGYRGGYVEVPVYTWRKANAIHKWIVDNYADGVDECQEINLPVSALVKLARDCSEVLANPEKAEQLMPTQDGFFFGPTEYDEYYRGELHETWRALTDLVVKIGDRKDLEIIYQASW